MRSPFRRVAFVTAAFLLAGLVAPVAAFATISTGDGVWKWQNPLPQGNSINDAAFVDAQTGWIVGDNGTIIHTDDAGATWTAQRSGTPFHMQSVSFPDKTHGWAVGNGYASLHYTVYPEGLVTTSDGGKTWHPQRVGIDDNTERTWIIYTGVTFVDSTHGWAVGSYHNKAFIVATTDGGRTWTRQGPNTQGFYLYSVCFVDRQHGWAAGSNGDEPAILGTSDGGAHWALQGADRATAGTFTAVCATDPLHVWAVGWGGVLTRSSDGGATWAVSYFGYDQLFRDVYFSDSDHGCALIDNGTLLRTADGGETWATAGIGAPDVVMTALAFGDAANGWAMGVQNSPAPEKKPVSCYLSKTTDGGDTWAPPASSVSADLQDVSFVSRSEGWAVGADGTILVTTDGGEAWTTQAAPVAVGLNDVDFVDSLTGWSVGAGGTILATVDGGTTWHQQPSPSAVDLDAVDFVDPQHGWAAGAGRVLRTSDGGLSWSSATVGSGDWTLDVESVSFVDADNGWVAGVLPAKTTLNGPRGCVYASDDGGATWTRQYVHDYISMHSVWFTDLRHGWLAGDQKQIMRTTDRGETWSKCEIVTEWADDTSMNDIMLSDSTHGWAVGTKGYILATSDGQHWIEEDSGATRTLQGVSFVDQGHGWVVGDGGLILEDPGPLCRAPYRSVVRRGQIATLRFKVSDAATVRVSVKILIRNSRGRISKKIELRNQRPNRMLTAKFRCGFARGTLHFYVYASDNAGNKAAVPAVNKLIVR